MRTAALAAIFALAAAPALGQSSPPAPSAQQPAPSAAAAQPSSATQAQLRESLEQAGFKHIQIVDETFVVHARTRDGEMSVMYIDPPPPAGAPGTTTSGPVADRARIEFTKAQLRQSLEKAGFTDVAIVGAAYLVKANTADGGNALMYINPGAAPATSGLGGQSGSPGQSSESTGQSSESK